MKLIIERNTMMDLVSDVIGAINKNHYIEVLRCVLIECDNNIIKVTGSNIDITIITKHSVELDERFTCAIDAIKLNSILRNYKKGDISLELKDGFVVVKQGRSTFKIKSYDVADYPTHLDENYDDEHNSKVVNSFSIESSLLCSMINKTQNSAALSDVRHYLNGLCFSFSDKLKLYGTNGHMLSYIESSINNTDVHSTIISKTALPLLTKILNGGVCAITAYKNRVVFDLNEIKMVCNVINEKTPDYDRLINFQYNKSFVIDRESITNTVKLASTLKDGKFFAVCFTKNNNALTICVDKDNNTFDDSIDIENHCDDSFDIKLNIDYILSVLSSLEGRDVTVSVASNDDNQSSKIKSVCIKSNDDMDGLHIIMPMR